MFLIVQTPTWITWVWIIKRLKGRILGAPRAAQCRSVFLSESEKDDLYRCFRDLGLRNETHEDYFQRVINLPPNNRKMAKNMNS